MKLFNLTTKEIACLAGRQASLPMVVRNDEIIYVIAIPHQREKQSQFQTDFEQLRNKFVIRIHLKAPFKIAPLLSKILCLWAFLLVSAVLSSQTPLFDHYALKEDMPECKVYDLAPGPEGEIWMASDKGICSFNGISFRMLPGTFGLHNIEILGFSKNAGGNPSCFSSSGQIYVYENDRFRKIDMDPGLKSNLATRIINGIAVDEKQSIWISTVIAGGLYHIPSGNQSMDKNTGWGKINSDQAGFSFFIRETGPNRFICGSQQVGRENNLLRIIFRNKKELDVALSEKGGYSKSRIICLNSGSFLYAKGHEILNFDSTGVISRAFVEKSVEDILQDSEGKIWVALNTGGIICYPGGNISSGGSLSYLGNKTVTSMLEDQSGNLWFATLNNGVYSTSVKPSPVYTSPEVFSNTGQDKKAEKPVALLPGLSRDSPPNPLSFIRGDIKIISQDTMDLSGFAPAIHVSGIKIMGRDTSISGAYTLAYDQNFLNINYAGFSFQQPEIMQYKYRMEGIDDKWVYTNNSSVQYTTLPPGNYTFTVSAMDNKGRWSRQPAVITFLIRPPFWQTWWFIASMAASAIILLVVIFGIWITQIKKREREKAEINRKIGEIQLQALRAQMNPHFIFNTLSSIQHFITSNDTTPALKYLSTFAKLMRSIMDNSQKPVIPLKDEMNALRLYLELESLRFKEKLEHSIEVDPSIDSNTDEIPSMLIQPYVENAILHGIMPKKEKGKVSIRLLKANGMIICTVTDDGIGINRSKVMKNTSKKHRSKGMSITKGRLEILNTLNNKNLSVNIHDRSELDPGLTGTIVEIFVPVN